MDGQTHGKLTMDSVEINGVVFVCLIASFSIFTASALQELRLDSLHGNVTSPGFPNHYAHNLDVMWRLDVQRIHNFTMSLNVWIEASMACKADELSIVDLSNRFTVLKTICGKWSTSQDTQIRFYGYGFLIQFTTDHSINDKGFVISYDSIQTDTIYICNKMQRYQEISTGLLGRSDQYPASVNCTWSIKARKGYFILLDFLDFDIEFSGDTCDADRLEIWIDNNDDGASIQTHTLCGQRNSWSFALNTSSVIIRFVSDDKDSTGGFRFEYKTTSVKYVQSFVPLQSIHTEVNRTKMSRPLPFFGLRDDLRSGVWVIRTIPGFNIQLQNNQDLSTGLQFYDGPLFHLWKLGQIIFTPSVINPRSGDVAIVTEGFVLTIVYRPVSYTVQQNLTFQAVNGFTSDQTIVNINGKTPMFVQIHRRLKYCAYVQTLGTVDKSTKLSLREVDFELPNIDNCLYEGIAIYNDYVSYNNLIGPFCDVSESYAENIVTNFIGSSSVFFVLYGYKNGGRLMSPNVVQTTLSACSAFYVKFHHRNELIQRKTFQMEIKQSNNEMSVNINFEETHGQCVIVYFVPELWRLNHIHLSLTGRFRYRICGVFSPTPFTGSTDLRLKSKYSLGESCTNVSFLENDSTLIDDILHVNGKWSKEMSRLELGFAEEGICPDIISCPREGNNIFSGYCGVLFTPDCIWHLQLPRTKKVTTLSWRIEIKGLYSEPDSTGVKLSEYLFNHTLVLETNVWLKDIGHLVTFDYRSIYAADILLTPKTLTNCEIAFQIFPLTKPYISKMSHANADCYIFGQKCYVMLTHDTPTSWLDSKRACKDRSGDLATLTNKEELEFIKLSLSTAWRETFYRTGPGRIYIGLDDIHKADDYRWSDGSPLSVSDWFYPFDVFNNVLPEYPLMPIEPSIIQPETDLSKRCVAMVPGNPSLSTNWMKIHCSEKLNKSVHSICEVYLHENLQNDTDLSQNNSDYNKSDTSKNDTSLVCPRKWTLFANRCLVLTTGSINLHESLTLNNAAYICNQQGGEIAHVQNLTSNQLVQFLQIMGMDFGSGDIWVRPTDSRTDCVSMTSLVRNMSLGGEIPHGSCHITEGRVGHVLCESNTRVQMDTCQSYQFVCDDKSCLTPDKICDSRNDCPSGEDELSCSSSHYFTCMDGKRVISISQYCDFRVDCLDGSDEEDCVHPTCSLGMYQCRNKECIRAYERCDQVINCIDRSDEMDCDMELICHGYRCPIAGCIPSSHLGDLHPDCPDKTQKDEIVTSYERRHVFYIVKYEHFVERSNYNPECPYDVNSQRCNKQRNKCYPRDKVCVYDHDEYGKLKYCRNGAHLRHCANYECPGMFKCPQSYCLPHHKVCDGIKDCVGGADETNCKISSCYNKLRCGQTSQCITQDHVCDGQRHCALDWDDERFCDLWFVLCPSNCTCQGYLVICRATGKDKLPIFRGFSKIRSLDLNNNSIRSVKKQDFHGWFYLASIDLSDNFLSSLEAGTFAPLLNLVSLDLSHNQLNIIVPSIFDNLAKLSNLILIGNPIHTLSDGSFLGLSSLRSLNLSGMMISELSDKTFSGMNSIKNLDLSNNILRTTGKSLLYVSASLRLLSLTNNSLELEQMDNFEGLNLHILQTDFYIFCCIPNSTIERCSPDYDVYSSCSSLLASDVSKTFVWVLFLLIFIGNAILLVWRLRASVQKADSVFTANLFVTNILVGIYLFGLGLAHQHFNGHYSSHDMWWRKGPWCVALEDLATTYWVKGLVTIEYMAIRRMAKSVLNRDLISFKMAFLFEGFSWICVAILLVYSIVTKSSEEISTQSSICSPLNFTKRQIDKVFENKNIFYFFNCIILCVIVFTLLFEFVMKKTLSSPNKQKGSTVARTADLMPVLLLHVLCLVLIIVADTLSVLGFSLSGPTISIFSLFVFSFPAFFEVAVFVFIHLRSIKISY